MYDFPQDLRDAQLALHQTRAAYEQCARTLPWSAVPMPGREGDKQLHSGYRSAKPDSPGCTDEQHREVARLGAELLELSTVVATHPFWATPERETVVRGRMIFEHSHDAPAVVEAA